VRPDRYCKSCSFTNLLHIAAVEQREYLRSVRADPSAAYRYHRYEFVFNRLQKPPRARDTKDTLLDLVLSTARASIMADSSLSSPTPRGSLLNKRITGWDSPIGLQPKPAPRAASAIAAPPSVGEVPGQHRSPQLQPPAVTAAQDSDNVGLNFDEFCALVRKREAGQHTMEELHKRFQQLDITRSGRIELHTYTLRDALARSVTRLSEIFEVWDEDGNGMVDLREFRRAVRSLGYSDVPLEHIDQTFHEFDEDNSGLMSRFEMQKKIRQYAGHLVTQQHALRRLDDTIVDRRGAVLSTTVKIDRDSKRSVSEQVREALETNMVRVIDLFRDWDEDGNGLVGRNEFFKGVAALGVHVTRAEANELFDEFDTDNSGSIEYFELHKLLRQSSARFDWKAIRARRSPLTAKSASHATCPFAKPAFGGYGFNHIGLPIESVTRSVVKSRFLEVKDSKSEPGKEASRVNRPASSRSTSARAKSRKAVQVSPKEVWMHTALHEPGREYDSRYLPPTEHATAQPSPQQYKTTLSLESSSSSRSRRNSRSEPYYEPPPYLSEPVSPGRTHKSLPQRLKSNPDWQGQPSISLRPEQQSRGRNTPGHPYLLSPPCSPSSNGSPHHARPPWVAS
jgi:hypothetical protein